MVFFDEEGSIFVIFLEKGKKEFIFFFCIFEWMKLEVLCLFVNGKWQNVMVKEGYVSLNCIWLKGDKVRLELLMYLCVIVLLDGFVNYFILYGLIVLVVWLGK